MVLTSNNAREMSDALKRRCLHLYIDFPSKELEHEIVRLKVPEAGGKLMAEVVGLVQAIRALDLKKAPSISETLDWARALVVMNVADLDDAVVKDTLATICKYEGDLRKAEKELVAYVQRKRADRERARGGADADSRNDKDVLPRGPSPERGVDGTQSPRVRRTAAAQRHPRLDRRDARRASRRRAVGTRRPDAVQERAARDDGQARARRPCLRFAVRPLLLRRRRHGRGDRRRIRRGHERRRDCRTSSTGSPRLLEDLDPPPSDLARALATQDTASLERMLRDDEPTGGHVAAGLADDHSGGRAPHDGPARRWIPRRGIRPHGRARCARPAHREAEIDQLREYLDKRLQDLGKMLKRLAEMEGQQRERPEERDKERERLLDKSFYYLSADRDSPDA